MSALSPEANAGRIALVTGGGTGIGRAVARALAATGAGLVICGRRPEPLEEVREELEAEGAECLAVPTDIREPEQVDALVAKALERFGSIDYLIANAGGQFQAAAEETTPKGWRAVHRLNVDANWNLTRTVATQSMIPNRRGVVIFSGFSPRRGTPNFAHSAAARAAMENLAAGLSLEWSRFGIRTLFLALGNIDTEALAGYGPGAAEEWARQVPLKRVGTPDEVGAVVAFMCSDDAGYVTGTTITIDGGADAWGFGYEPPELEG